jgi:N utilization substance protein A
MAVNNELFNEKIDIIEWSEDSQEYIIAALSPAQASSVEETSSNSALVLVPEDQLSLAIGKGGQNVRLAAKLTGWRIDVRSQSNPDATQEGGVAQAPEEEEPDQEAQTEQQEQQDKEESKEENK